VSAGEYRKIKGNFYLKRRCRMAKRIIIGGGGTGGHIFPAISIANALNGIDCLKLKYLFVGAEGKIEMEKVPEAGYKIIGLPVAGLQRKISAKNLSFPYKLLKSMVKSRRILNDFKPDFALGVGGYASGPILKAASGRGIPIAIQEQNSYAGLTNKLLAKKASAIFVAYEGMEKYFPSEKIILTGNPVRKDVIDFELSGNNVHEQFGLSDKKKTILAIGGSLGARTINESIALNLDKIGEDAQLIWQTGKYYYENLKRSLEGKTGKNIILLPFIKEMNHAFKAADVIISRAGAGTISELAIVGKPVILVPSPNVAEDHQTKNAMALTNINAAIHIKDAEAHSSLVETAMDLLNDEQRRKELSQNIKKLALPESARHIAEEILKLI
jgi:UDP-N-acetylglucosamine--N-acetylmuramyl-(pentapeptide) pyrophosphoryl-undecaprenol N-acetylglucosamine transferase